MSNDAERDRLRLIRYWTAIVIGWIVLSPAACYLALEYRPAALPVVIAAILAVGYWFVLRPLLLLAVFCYWAWRHNASRR